MQRWIALSIVAVFLGSGPVYGSGATPSSFVDNSDPSSIDVGPDDCVLLYFYTPGCSDCSRVNDILRTFQKSHPHLHIIALNLLDSDAATLNKGLCLEMGFGDDKHGVAPSLFGDSNALFNPDITPHTLLELIESSRGKVPPWVDANIFQKRGKKAMEERYQNLTPLIVLSAGLVDGINPCAFAAIIFFLTYMTYVGKDRKEIVIAGLLYTLAVFAAYLAIGIGLHYLISAEPLAMNWFRRVVYVFLIALLVTAAILSIRDAIACRRGNLSDVTLKLPDALKRRIRLHITRQTRHGLTVVGAVSLGFVVALLEFPCTGQTYVPIITYLSVRPVGAFGWLLVYNLCFIFPLIIVFLCVLFGTSNDQIQTLFKRHLAKAKIAISVVFILMAGILILTFP